MIEMPKTCLTMRAATVLGSGSFLGSSRSVKTTSSRPAYQQVMPVVDPMF